eukprot:jgi/Astpho2/6097/Aster-04044
MFRRLLAEEGETWETVEVQRADPPSDEVLGSYDGLVITGSAADSFAQEAWIMKLRKSLTAASERRQRILAICFGHQLMSIVLGGMTARATDFEGGARTIMTNRNFGQHWATKDLPPDWEFRIHETHSDAVTRMPQQAQLLGSSKITDVEVISQGDWFLGLQGHPEFTAEFQRALLESRCKKGSLTQQQRDESIASLDNNPLRLEDIA